MGFPKNAKKNIDVIIFIAIFLFLVGGQLISKTNEEVHKQQFDPNSRLLTISNLTQVCIEEPSEASVCYDIKDLQYSVLLVKGDSNYDNQILITYSKGR